MREEFIFGDQPFVYEKSEAVWDLRLKRSDIASQDLRELLILDLHHPLFLEQSVQVDEDHVTFRYELAAHGLSYEEMRARPVSERLRLALNVFGLAEALDLPVTFLLHPSNLQITKDAQIKIAYRGVAGIMAPKSMSPADFLRQAVCFTVTLFSSLDFMTLYQGGLELEDLPAFLTKLREAGDLDSARGLLETVYLEEKTKEEATLTLVSSRRFRLYQLASLWLGLASVVLLLPLLYLVFFQNPFKEKLLQADTAFLKVDYSGVIDRLEGVAPASLPMTQKYELATAYIQGLELSDDQKKVVLNNVSLKSDALYLTYWIQLGRHDFEAALDTGKRLNDSDLILYALSQEIQRIRADESLSGQEREDKLEALEGDYDKYWDSRSQLLSSSSSDRSESSTEASASETSASSSEAGRD